MKKIRIDGKMNFSIILSVFVMIFSNLSSTIINIPDEFETIQEGINESVNGDTILVEQGEYFENLNFLGKAITVASNHLVLQDTTIIQNTIINGNTEDVVYFENNEDSLSIICGFSIINGYVGIWCLNGSSPKILDNYIFDNSASGIACTDLSSPLIIGNRICNNTYNGIYCNDFCEPEILDNFVFENNYPNIWCGNSSNAIITGNSISNEEVENNGIYVNNSSVLITNNSILNCGYPSIYIINSTNTIISENEIDNPQSNGISIFNSTISISRNLISNCGYPGIYCGDNTDGDIVNNIIDESEWGLYLENQSNVNIIGNVISNSPKDGICIVNSNPFIVNNTIVNNGLDYPNCAGIYLSGDSEAEIFNSIIWNNAYDFLFSNNLSIITIYNSLIEADSFPEQVVDNGGNLLAINPLFIDETNHNYGLQEFSPCIDSGTLNLPNGVNLPQLDLSNNERIYNSQIDMGAYEWNPQIGIESGVIENFNKINLTNYPNPFNFTTTISFSIPNERRINLDIYNIKGQKIKTLVQNVLTKGSHSFIWNGANESGRLVSSGVYFYKLSVDGKPIAAKKCMLLK